MKTKIIGISAGIAIALFTTAGIAFADTVGPITFESPTYTVGSINGQDGWTSTGVYDQGVVSSPVISGSQSFRISNAVTSGSFGDQTFSKPLVNSAGETGSDSSGFPQGTLQSHFESQFTIEAIPDSIGDFMSVSPDTGNGGRMSYLSFDNESDGIHVNFYDVQGTSDPANFVETSLGTLSAAVPHTIKFSMDFVNGPSNDVVNIYIDGNLVHTGTSWENYYRYDSESNPAHNTAFTHSVRSMLFRESGDPVTANAGKGFLIDDLSLLSSTPPSTVTVTIDKFIDNAMATAATANSSAFPMVSSWSATNIGSGSGSYTLSTVGFNSPNAYEAVTADMTSGASYATNEVTGGTVVGADCTTGQPYALVGYKSGDTLAAAQTATLSPTSPSFTNITNNKVVLVLNKMCLVAPVITSPANNTFTTTAGQTLVDWTDVSDPAGGITYTYQASNSSATNPDGSFVSPVYTSAPLSASQISTAGTPEGVYYLQVKATDADGNSSGWSPTVKVTVDNTAPTITITTPVDGATYPSTPAINANYSCADALSGIASCTGDAANGSAIDMLPGTHSFTVVATDKSGNVTTKAVNYTVSSPVVTVPTMKDQCMNNAWKTHKDSLGNLFKNQGDCVSFVATKGKNTGAGGK